MKSELKPINTKKPKEQLATLDLSQYLPSTERIKGLDISQWLTMGLLLKEKEYRNHLKDFNWSEYSNSFVHVYCSTDAILAPWAFMLVQVELQKVHAFAVVGTEKELIHEIILNEFNHLDWSTFADKIVLIKGCGDKRIDHWAYMKVTQLLSPYSDRINYGEACSFVPVYKKSKRAIAQ
jgi:hypothetical protein